jgi:hypothetical protein
MARITAQPGTPEFVEQHQRNMREEAQARERAAAEYAPDTSVLIRAGTLGTFPVNDAVELAHVARRRAAVDDHKLVDVIRVALNEALSEARADYANDAITADHIATLERAISLLPLSRRERAAAPDSTIDAEGIRALVESGEVPVLFELTGADPDQKIEITRFAHNNGHQDDVVLTYPVEAVSVRTAVRRGSYGHVRKFAHFLGASVVVSPQPRAYALVHFPAAPDLGRPDDVQVTVSGSGFDVDQVIATKQVRP